MLFVPSEERITALTNTVSDKFSFIESIKIAVNSLVDVINNVGNAPKLTIDVKESKYTEAQSLTILNLSWYAPFKSYGDLIITGFVYAMYIWHLFIKLPGVISGTSGGIEVIERKLND